MEHQQQREFGNQIHDCIECFLMIMLVIKDETRRSEKRCTLLVYHSRDCTQYNSRFRSGCLSEIRFKCVRGKRSMVVLWKLDEVINWLVSRTLGESKTREIGPFVRDAPYTAVENRERESFSILPDYSSRNHERGRTFASGVTTYPFSGARLFIWCSYYRQNSVPGSLKGWNAHLP